MTIEDGRYTAKAIEWKLGMTSTGKEQIGVLFQLSDGRTISWYGYFTENTVDRTLESMEHMGWDGLDITAPKGLDANEVSIVVEGEASPTDGKMYPRVKWVNKVGGGLAMKEELSGGALQSFKQRMQGAVMARRQSRGAPAQTQKKRPMRQPGDDDLPDDPGFDSRFDDCPI